MDNETKQSFDRLEKMIIENGEQTSQHVGSLAVRIETFAVQIETLAVQLEKLAVMTQQGFEEVNKRFEAVDKRFENVDKRFEDMKRSLDEVKKELLERIEYIESNFADKDFVMKQVIRLEHFMRDNIPQLLRLDKEFKSHNNTPSPPLIVRGGNHRLPPLT